MACPDPRKIALVLSIALSFLFLALSQILLRNHLRRQARRPDTASKPPHVAALLLLPLVFAAVQLSTWALYHFGDRLSLALIAQLCGHSYALVAFAIYVKSSSESARRSMEGEHDCAPHADFVSLDEQGNIVLRTVITAGDLGRQEDEEEGEEQNYDADADADAEGRPMLPRYTQAMTSRSRLMQASDTDGPPPPAYRAKPVPATFDEILRNIHDGGEGE